MAELPIPTGESIIESGFSHYIIIGCSVAGIVWGGINAVFVSLASLAGACLDLAFQLLCERGN